MYTLSLESGGDEKARNPESSAVGLMQILSNRYGGTFAGRPSDAELEDPEFNIRYAAEQLGAARGDFSAWGENSLFEGRPFGALGARPYGGPPVATARTGGTPDLGGMGLQTEDVPSAIRRQEPESAIDYSAAPTGSLRERLEQQRRGRSQYGALPLGAGRAAFEFATESPVSEQFREAGRSAVESAVQPFVSPRLPSSPAPGAVPPSARREGIVSAAGDVGAVLGEAVAPSYLEALGVAPAAGRAIARAAPDIASAVVRNAPAARQAVGAVGSQAMRAGDAVVRAAMPPEGALTDARLFAGVPTGGGDDLSAQLEASLKAMETDPAAAKAAFREAARTAGKQIADEQQAASALYRETELLTRRAAGLSGKAAADLRNKARQQVGEALKAEKEARIYGPAADELPPISGGANAAAVLDAQQTATLAHFTDMTKGVIDNNSTMQGVYNAARPFTTMVSGDVADSKLAELVARESELRTALTRVGPKLTTDEMNTVVKVWREGMLKRSFTGNDLKKATQTLAERARAASKKPGTVDAIQETFRSMALNFDISVLGQQIEAAVRRGVVPTTVGVLNDTANRIASKLNMPGAVQVYLRNDIDHVSQAIADGLQMGGGQTADIATKRGLFGRIPRVGPQVEKALDGLADFQYGAMLGTVRLRAYEGLLVQNKILHDISGGKLGGDISDPLVRRHIAESANTIGSTARRATGAKRAAVEQRGLLTARMTRAQINEVLQPLKSFRSQEDVVNTLNYLASVAVTLGAGKALNDQFGIGGFVMNPLEQGFGQITLPSVNSEGKHHVIDIMPQDAFAQALIKSVDALGDGDWEKLADAWTRFGFGRLNLLPQDALRFGGYGYDAEGRFHSGDLPKQEALAGAVPVPLGVRETLIAGETDPVSVGLTVTGQGGFPESTTGLKNREATDRFGGKPNPLGGNYPGSVKYDELAPSDQRAIDELPGVTQSAASNQSDYQKRKAVVYKPITDLQGSIEADFAANKLDRPLRDALHDQTVRKEQARHDLETEFTKEFSKYERDRFDKALTGYFDQEVRTGTGAYDGDATEAAQNRYLEGLDPKEQAWIENFLSVGPANDTPFMKERREYLNAKEQAGYFKLDRNAPDYQKRLDELDRANPQIDAQSWYYGGGELAKQGAGPALQTAQAVDLALQKAPERPVKYAGVPRAVNETEGTLAAWKASAPLIVAYHEAGDEALRRAVRGALSTDKAFAALSEEKKQERVVSEIRERIRKSGDAAAALIWFNRFAKPATTAEFQSLMKFADKYGPWKPAP